MIESKDEIKILMLEDQLMDEELIVRQLKKANIKFIYHRIETKENFIKGIHEFKPDIILSDYRLPSFDGISALAVAAEICPDVPFIIVSGTIEEERLIEIMKSGATDYVSKDRLGKLVPSLERALRDVQQKLEKVNNEANLSALIENTDNNIWSINSNYELVIFNSSFKRMIESIYNTSPEVGMKIYEFLPIYKQKESLEIYKRVLDGEKITLQEEFEINGSTNYYETSYSPIFLNNARHIKLSHDSAGNNITGVTVYSQNISERKKTEQQIHEQAALLDLTPDAIIVCDMESRILFWNKGAERLYNFPAEEAIGKKPEEIYLSQSELEINNSQKDVLEKGEWHGELHHITRQGKEIVVDSHWILMHNLERQIKSILMVSSDITEKKATESDLLRTQRMESIGSLASGIAHDLNNILSPVLMSTAILKRKITDPKILRIVNTLEISASRGADIIKQILTFSRLSQAHEKVDINKLMNGIENIISGTFPKSIISSINIQPDIWDISGDKTQLYQVLLNICVNARDAMPEGGKLSINVENIFIDKHYSLMEQNVKEGKYIVISISDTGEGIKPEIISKIFDSFFTTKEVGKGTGIGLSIVNKIVKNHKGFINVYSEVGKGTTFKIYIPSILSLEGDDSDNSIEETNLGAGELILVVDDEPAIREITKETLEEHGYNVVLASDGTDAISLYVQYINEIKVIIMDMNMPKLDGLSTIQIIRKINPNIKIIAVSGLNDNTKDINGITEYFLEKPFTASKILKLLIEALNKI